MAEATTTPTPNVFYISGDTYEHRQALVDVGASFDEATKCWIASLDNRVTVEEVCQRLGLKATEVFDPKFRAPDSEAEKEKRRAGSLLLAAQVKRLEGQRKIAILPEGPEREALQAVDKELEEKISRLKEDKFRLEKTVRNNAWARLEFTTLAERKGDWFTDTPPKQPMLLQYVRRAGDNIVEQVPFLPASIVAGVVGQGGSGKTRLVTQLAFSISTGRPFLGSFEVVGGPGKVFLCLGEEPSDGIQRRLHAVGQMHREAVGKDADAAFALARKNIVPFSCRGMDMRLIDDDGVATMQYLQLLEGLKASAGEGGYRLIILDPLSRFLSGETEKDANAATKLIALLEKLTIEIPGHPTVVCGHHMNKAGEREDQGAARGSSAITDGFRAQYNLWTPESKKDSSLTHLRAFKTAKVNDVRFMPRSLILKFTEHGTLLRALSTECPDQKQFDGYSQSTSAEKASTKTKSTPSYSARSIPQEPELAIDSFSRA